jgi:serine/threonine protein kinase
MSNIARDGGEGSVFGRYRLLRELGRGGMGVVYRAVVEGPQGFARSCVIKRIVPHLSSDEGFAHSLAAEARLSGLLVHPGIVQVYEFGVVNGEYYLAMEYVDGISLWQVARRCEQTNRTVPPGVACFLIAELAVALGYAHALRGDDGRALEIVHRDVSPSNVMLGRAGMVKLLDFGIARAASHMRDANTRTGTLKGKFAYMSPEQAEGLTIDGRSDLFALGVLFWEALTQRRLFSGGDDLQTLRLVREAKVAPTGIDAELDAVLLKTLSRDPAQRWSTGDELAAALQPIAHRLGGNLFSMRRFVAEMLDLPDPKVETRAEAKIRTPLQEATQNLTKPTKTPSAKRAEELLQKRIEEPTSTPSNGSYEIKGSLVRAYTQQIADLGILSPVLNLVRPETRKLMTDLPISNTWIDAMVIEDMINQVESLRGIEAVRVVTRSGINGGVLPILKPAVMPLLRLFGTSPHTLLSRFGKFTKNNVRGLEFEWMHDGERAGTLRVQFPRKNIPRTAFIGFESAMVIICDLCAVNGTISEVEMSRDGSSGLVHVHW